MIYAALLVISTLAPTQGTTRPPAEILSEIRSMGREAPVALFEELAIQRTMEAFEALLKGMDAVPPVDKTCGGYRAMRHFKGVADVEPAVIEFLAERATQSSEKLALNAVYRLGPFWPAAKSELVELALEHETADGRSVAMMFLIEHDMPLKSKALKRLMRSKDADVRYEGLLASTARLQPDPKRSNRIVKLAKSKDPIERLVAIELLATLEVPGRLEILRAHLEDKDSRVARKSIASLERTRDKAAVGLLIARLSSASQGGRYRVSLALGRLTGKSLGLEPGRWKRWWDAEGGSYEFPDSPAKPTQKEPTASTSSSFYGLPIFAEDIVFAIDASKSMRKPAGGTDEHTRMEVAKRELSKAIQNLPEESTFDIVHFGKSAWSWRGELVTAKAKNKRAALGHLQYMDLTFGTEIYAALREAFRSPEVDTVLFLTDGDPVGSLLQDRAGVRRIVKQWNRTRHISVDCLTIGTDRPWLQKIAEETGGRYKQVE